MEHYRDPETDALLRFNVGRVAWTTLRCDETTDGKPRWISVNVPPEQATRLERLPEDVAPRYEAELRTAFAITRQKT